MAASLPRISLRLLGPVQIEQNGDLIEKLGSQKSLILLAYLIRHPHEHSRAKLASLLWMDQPQRTARSNLRWALNNLSKLVPGLIEATRQTLHFAPSEALWLDLEDFAHFASPSSGLDNELPENHLDRLAQAITLYRGDFLEGLTIEDAPDLELWLLQEREYWRRRVVTLLERLIEGYAARNQYYHAERFANQLLMHEPWREETHQQLMWLLSVTGQRSAALSQFETCRQILASELAVEPSSATVALYERIRDNTLVVERATPTKGTAVDAAPIQPPPTVRHRQGRLGTQPECTAGWSSAGAHASVSAQNSGGGHGSAPAPRVPAVPHNLPRERTPFVGRQVELADLRTLLLKEARPLVTLIGEGGVGKSRLALAAAESLIHVNPSADASADMVFRNGVWFVPLVGIDAQQTIDTALVTAIAAAVHLQLAGAQSPFQQLVDFLRRKALLLVLDNMEHLVEGALVLSDILAEAPSVQMLVTSRIPLDLQEEWRYTLQGMTLPEPLAGAIDEAALTTLQQNSSVALFVQTGQRVDHQFALTAQNQCDVVAICRYLHGLPLALELAATGLAQMRCRELATALI
ncbi:MAG TPA: BTAD domain-containing putative transcriptional regulator, partial [Caldilineaceae bacterium]|nr:BTAD domain-containing putative transcriptional regulator [Caldilineaceae bacterium]